MYRHLVAALFGLLILVAGVHAQPWPSKPITFIVPAAAAGSTDFIGRMLAEPLSRALRQTIVVENRPGASGNIGAEATLRAPADGYTFLIQYSGYHVGNPALFPDLRWKPGTDFTGVAMLMRAPHVIAVSAALPVRSLKELMDYGRRSTKGLLYASSGQGSIQHIAGELFGQATRVAVTHVPYKGAAPALNDLIGGQVDLFITTPPSVVGHAKAGKVKMLAYTAKRRHPALADVPTSAEAGLAGYEIESWFAVFAAAATPRPIVDRLSVEIRKVVEDQAFRQRIEEQGAFASYMDPATLDGFVREELDAWAKVIRTANIKRE